MLPDNGKTLQNVHGVRKSRDRDALHEYGETFV